MQKRSILLPTYEYPPSIGGIGRYVAMLEEALDGVGEVIELPKVRSTISTFFFLLSRRRGVRSIWVNHVLPLGSAAFLLKVVFGIPYVVFLHGNDFDQARVNRRKKMLLRRVLRGAKHIVANSEALCEEVERFSGRPVKTIYPVLSKTFIDAFDTLDRGKRESDHLRLLTVARLVKRKGHEHVIKSLKDLNKVTYQIVGSGPYELPLKNLVSAADLEDRVEFSGALAEHDLVKAYQSSDVFVMLSDKSSSDREGFGIVYLEAQFAGLPILAKKQPGVDEALDPDAVLYVESGSELTAAIDKLKDGALRQQMSDAGKRFAKHFMPASMHERIRSLV